MRGRIGFGEWSKLIGTARGKRYLIRSGQREGVFYLLRAFFCKACCFDHFELLAEGQSVKAFEALALKWIRGIFRSKEALKSWLRHTLYKQLVREERKFHMEKGYL